jgi:hypothetical protein
MVEALITGNTVDWAIERNRETRDNDSDGLHELSYCFSFDGLALVIGTTFHNSFFIITRMHLYSSSILTIVELLSIPII